VIAMTDSQNSNSIPSGTEVLWREFHFVEGTSNKFWKIKLSGNMHTVIFGRIGASGQEQTKSFDDEAKARKDYDKLISQKTSKGYVEVGAGPSATTSPDAGVAATANSKPAAKKAKVTKSTDDAVLSAKSIGDSASTAQLTNTVVSFDSEVRHNLNLDPTDWFWAMWRDPEPLPRPEPPRFDKADRIQRLRKYRGGYPFDATSVIRADSLSPEEANFWLAALTTDTSKYGSDHFKEVANILEKTTIAEKFSLDEMKPKFSRYSSHRPEVALCLGTFISPREICDLINSEWIVTDHWRTQATVRGWGKWMIPGFQRYILPYMSRAEREDLKAHIKPLLKQLPVLDDEDEDVQWSAWMLAGILGLHDEVEQAIKSWPDDVFRERTHIDYKFQLIATGLRNANVFEEQWRRMGMYVNDFQQYGWDRPPTGTMIRVWLAHTEFKALDVVRDGVLAQTNKEGSEELLSTFAGAVDAAEAAPTMLELSQFSKTPRIARQWLEARLATSIAGLLPLLQRNDKLATDALAFIQDQMHAGHAALVESQVAALPDELAQIVRKALAADDGKNYEPLSDSTTPAWLKEALATAQKPLAGSDFVAVRRLTPITLDSKKLTDDQVHALLRILQRATLTEPPNVCELLKQQADRASLDAFVWNLFEQWAVEANSKQKWAMTAMGLLGGDQVALKLTPLLRKWPGESQHQRAVTGLECLRAIGSDTALMQLNGIAQKVPFKGIKQKAQEFMEEIAKQKGLTRAQLEDRIVPDCDLDGRGSRTFDFGPRRFMFTLSSDMKPIVRDEEKKLLKDLPKPNSKDDSVKAEQAVAEWKLLKAQLREVLKIQVGRLEQAMVTGRLWPVVDFENFLVKHPLMINLVRTVVWGVYDAKGKLLTTFRITEEQDYADAQDKPFQIPQEAQVGIAHPLHVDAATARVWGELLGDYEIAAPFPQFGRAVYTLEPTELNTKALSRFKGTKIVALTLVFTLEKFGWSRGVAMDGGCFDEHSKQFPAANVTAIVNYEGTVAMGYIDPNETLILQDVIFVPGMRAPSGYGEDLNKALKLSDVSPVVLSEVMADLTALSVKGT
jgi:predicted DNA-binding WGR domain protein